MTTSIEWTDETWNPTVGCSKTSPGCDHCYAITVARREMSAAHKGLTVNGDWTGEVRHLPDRLDTPMHWRRPRRIFVNSMSDLFHKDVGPAFIASVFDTMAKCPQHTFQVLTKRPQRMLQLMSTDVPGERQPLPNVWLGTSIESDRYLFRSNYLRGTPAAVRFLSLEPLLGPLPRLNLDGIGWVIVGGESGHGARPMDINWVREIRDQCIAAGVPFLFKQWGEWAPTTTVEGYAIRRVGKKAAGRLLDGRTWDEFPETVGA